MRRAVRKEGTEGTTARPYTSRNALCAIDLALQKLINLVKT